MSEFMWKVYFQLLGLKTMIFEDENGDVNIVSIVVLIGIAVALAVFFRGQISGLLQTLFSSITTNATNAVQ